MENAVVYSFLPDVEKQVHAILQDHYLPPLMISHEELIKLLDNYVRESKKFAVTFHNLTDEQDRIKILNQHIQFRKSLPNQLDQWISERKRLDKEGILIIPSRALLKFTEKLPVKWVELQERERFIRQKNDSPKTQFFKLLKRIGYALTVLPVITKNKILKLFNKTIHPLPQWTHSIRSEKVIRWCYEIEFLEKYKRIHDHALKKTAVIAHKIFDYDHRFFYSFNEYVTGREEIALAQDKWEKEILPGLQELYTEIEKCKEELAADFRKILGDTDDIFEQEVRIAGTLEYPSFKRKEGNRKKTLKNIHNTYENLINKRYNTLYILADDWKFNQDVYVLKGVARKSYLAFKSRLRSRTYALASYMDKIPDALEKTSRGIAGENAAEFKKSVAQLKYTASKSFSSKIIPEISELLLEQNYPVIIDEIEQILQNELASMATGRVIVDGFDPEKGYNEKSLQPIVLLELVEFEMMKQVKKVLLNAKMKTIEKLEHLNTELENLGRMVVFNLDSALAMLDEQGDEGLENCIKDAESSMERAVENYFTLKQQFDDYTVKLEKDIEETLFSFSGKLTDLTDNSRVADIKYRITKGKAIKKSEQIWIRLNKNFESLKVKTTSFFRFTLMKLETGIDNLKSRLGIKTLPQNISFEISEFLVTGRQKIDSLPFVYRRLFFIEPLKDQNFYLRRNEELEKLERAYEKWKLGNFTPVLVYGEKGSGVSTFINLFVKEKIKKAPVVYSVIPPKRILSEEDLLALLGLSFRAEPFKNTQELYDFVEQQENFIAFADKLHMYYLRQPGGFSLLKKFFEIISNTSRKVFWLCTCNLYASAYLDKSIGLYDYFPVIIEMRKLSIEQVRQMIIMRHKASGYQLEFKPSKGDLADRKFSRNSKEKQQTILQEKYFDSLNEFTRSNIAFALQLWLRSAEKQQGNTIRLNSLDDIDFGFMLNLPPEVFFVLHALVLHESLDVFQLSRVLNNSRRQAYLLVMRLSDRGIVKEINGLYTIHELLYRETIMLLKTKNLIQ